MSEQVMVSIICNAYNHGKYIRETLEGFVTQKTNFIFEILVHDDASTDDTADIIREYEAKYPELIKPIYQTENQYSKKIGINKTYQVPRIRGKYVALCEGDDYWTNPMKLQKQFDFMEANPDYSLCTCSTDWYNMRSGVVENKCRAEKDMDVTLEEIILEKHGRIFQYASYFLKAEIIKEFPEWRIKFPIGDYPLAIQCALSGKVHMLADCMSVYRYYSEGSWTARMDGDEHRIRVSERMLEGLDALNEATDLKYNDVITQRKNVHEYFLALCRHDLDTIRKGKLKEMYRNRPLIKKISDILHCKCPKLFVIMRKLAKK